MERGESLENSGDTMLISTYDDIRTFSFALFMIFQKRITPTITRRERSVATVAVGCMVLLALFCEVAVTNGRSVTTCKPYHIDYSHILIIKGFQYSFLGYCVHFHPP